MSQFPRGRLNPDDKGAIRLNVTVEQDCVVLTFPSPVTWIAMPAEQAIELANVLLETAKEAKRQRH